ncbi:hypothetical protein ACGF0J_14165 [Nonomuraea sp. NPDC047897]|uniref:hypothetical protein n=1 Tax=Nonomuraea sp. NPDC047897 TaxID=3364346 RepID=UPI003711CDB7
MISQETHPWLAGMATMSIASWGAEASSLLILIEADRLTSYAAVLLLVWAVAVSAPVTFHAVWCWRRVRAARQARMLGQKHARLFEIMAGEITSLR